MRIAKRNKKFGDIMDKYQKKIDKTKQRLKRAFTEISKNHSLITINVKNICEQAGVGRSTFYLHYENVDSLTREVAEELLNEIEEILLCPVSHEKLKDENKQTKLNANFDEMKCMLEYLFENRSRMLPFIYPQEYAYFVNSFKAIMDKKLNLMKETTSFYNSDTHINLFMSIGITGTMFHWLIFQDMTVEEILAMSFKFTKLIEEESL